MRRIRYVLGAVVVVSVLVLASSALGGGSAREFTSTLERQAALPMAERTPMVSPRPNATVLTSQFRGHLAAFAPNGTLLYYADAHDDYWDVDPSPLGRWTVLYTATDRIPPADTRCDPNGEYCVRQIIARANLSTGTVTRLYSRIGPRYHSSEWHDVDRLNDTHLLVADMAEDRVFVIDVRTGTQQWGWDAQQAYPLSVGGPFPGDWTHLNDVSVLPDGRVMVSLRNMDQVVFLDNGTVDGNWTLGTDNNHTRLYEQHNPDYIPRSAGGPAVLVADSENNRIVEYQRVGDGWRRTWVWSDARLQWARDADRLPNGHTLIADTRGGRVLEVGPNGTVVWSAHLGTVYDAERLGTGAESTGGASARRLDLASQTGGDFSRLPTLGDRAAVAIKGLLPDKLVNAAANGRPDWMNFWDQFVFLAGLLAAAGWITVEIRRAPYRLRAPIERRD